MRVRSIRCAGSTPVSRRVRLVSLIHSASSSGAADNEDNHAHAVLVGPLVDIIVVSWVRPLVQVFRSRREATESIPATGSVKSRTISAGAASSRAPGLRPSTRCPEPVRLRLRTGDREHQHASRQRHCDAEPFSIYAQLAARRYVGRVPSWVLSLDGCRPGSLSIEHPPSSIARIIYYEIS